MKEEPQGRERKLRLQHRGPLGRPRFSASVKGPRGGSALILNSMPCNHPICGETSSLCNQKKRSSKIAGFWKSRYRIAQFSKKEGGTRLGILVQSLKTEQDMRLGSGCHHSNASMRNGIRSEPERASREGGEGLLVGCRWIQAMAKSFLGC